VSTYIRTATVLVRVNTGPPTWWRPNFGIELDRRFLHIRFGWLRACVQIGFGTRRHPEEES
jgi:hypothetical protein